MVVVHNKDQLEIQAKLLIECTQPFVEFSDVQPIIKMNGTSFMIFDGL